MALQPGRRGRRGLWTPGFIADSFSTKSIQNQPNWASLRLGGELRVKLWDRLSLIADAAALPVAYV
jgi:hypothetical protein